MHDSSAHTPNPHEAAAGGVLPESSAEHLLVRVAMRDRAAFAELYERAAPQVLRVLRRILGESASAEDLLQDVFWHVWERADRFDPGRGRAHVWLIVIARSKAIDFVRRHRRERTVGSKGPKGSVGRTEGSAEAAPLDVRAPVDPDPLETEDEHDKVRAELRALPAEQRVLLECAFFDGQTHAEIAKSLGLPLGTVKTRIRSALATLRAAFVEKPKTENLPEQGKEGHR